MKVKKCPARKHCFDYKDNNCDDCDFGNEFTKLHKRIDRLKKQNETLTIQRNAWYLTAERVGEDFKKAKADVAREIFAEIEKIIEKHHGECYEFEDGDECDTAITYISYISVDIAELKKKYTEGEPNG